MASSIWNAMLYVGSFYDPSLYGQKERDQVEASHKTLNLVFAEVEARGEVMSANHKALATELLNLYQGINGLQQTRELFLKEVENPDGRDLKGMEVALKEAISDFESRFDTAILGVDDKASYEAALKDLEEFQNEILGTIERRELMGPEGIVAIGTKDIKKVEGGAEEVSPQEYQKKTRFFEKASDFEKICKSMDKLDDFCTGGPVVSFVRGCIDAVKAAAKAVYNAGPDLGIESGKFKEGVKAGWERAFKKAEPDEPEVGGAPTLGGGDDEGGDSK